MFWRETLAHSYLGFKFSHYKVERNQNIAVAHNRQWMRFITDTWIRVRRNGPRPSTARNSCERMATRGCRWREEYCRFVTLPPTLFYSLVVHRHPSSGRDRRNSLVRGDDTVAPCVRRRRSYRVNYCLHTAVLDGP